MAQGTRPLRLYAYLTGISVCLSAAVVLAQQRPVAALFTNEQKKDAALALSFVRVDIPPASTAGTPLGVYLSAGDLVRALDKFEFRPDAAIVPTNTDLSTTASSPSTQRVLIDRVRKQPDVMHDLEAQITARRTQSPAAADKEPGVLRIGIDTFVAQLPRQAGNKQSNGAFPKLVCLIATDYAGGGAIDHRELFAQDRTRRGIAACLAALDAAGAQSVVLPLLGAASSGKQTNDPLYEGQRVLKECRLINSIAGIALGLHDFAPGRRNLREIGVIQWDQEITGMFTPTNGDRSAQIALSAYRTYAEQINQAFRKGLAGDKTGPGDVDGTCNSIFSVQ